MPRATARAVAEKPAPKEKPRRAEAKAALRAEAEANARTSRLFRDDVDAERVFARPAEPEPQRADFAAQSAEPDDDRRPWRRFARRAEDDAPARAARGDFDDSDFQEDDDSLNFDAAGREAQRDDRRDGDARGRRLRAERIDSVYDRDRVTADDRALRDEALRFIDAGEHRRRPEKAPAPVVDVDYESVGDDDRLGRRLRAERRRSTALARVEDFDPIAERLFNEEVFAALRVQPRELEQALRKARRRAESRDKNRLTPWRAVGWFVWLAVAGVTAFAAFTYRNEIVAMFPKASGAYAVFGIEASPYGLRIENIGHRLAMSTDGPTIEITGRLRNAGDAPATAPPLQAEALGRDGEVLSRWTFEATEARIEQGASAAFSTRARAPEGVASVALSFAPLSAPETSDDAGRIRRP